MVEGTLYTFNFKVFKKIKKLIVYLLSLSLINCSSQNSEWFRNLPNQSLPSVEIPLGVYRKKIHSRAPMNSRYVFHEHYEKIELLPKERFVREYESIWIKGAKVQKTNILAKGIYKTKGNWVLFTFQDVKYQFFENEQKLDERKLDVKNRLLYYFWKNEKVLVPMIYETGFEEKNFGVKDGVKIPYNDSAPQFFRYLQFYTYEEYQSHAYFLEQKN